MFQQDVQFGVLNSRRRYLSWTSSAKGENLPDIEGKMVGLEDTVELRVW